MTQTETSLAYARERWATEWQCRKMLLGGWVIYQPSLDDPDDLNRARILAELNQEQEADAKALTEELNRPRSVLADRVSDAELASACRNLAQTLANEACMQDAVALLAEPTAAEVATRNQLRQDVATAQARLWLAIHQERDALVAAVTP